MQIPVRAYIVCATPRSGSTLLCEMLAATGRAGNPLEHFEVLRHSSLPRQPREYFLEADAAPVRERLPPLEQGAPSTELAPHWWSRVLAEGLSANGVWGGKLMWGHVQDFVMRARELDGLTNADLETVLRKLLGDPCLIHVAREDHVAQAVSLWRAVQTQAWRSGGGQADDSERDADDRARYDFLAIDHLVDQLQTQDEAWRSWFRSSRFEPLGLSYEDVERDPGAAVAGILRALGLPDEDLPVPPTARQRDARSEQWAARYREERKEAA